MNQKPSLSTLTSSVFAFILHPSSLILKQKRRQELPAFFISRCAFRLVGDLRYDGRHFTEPVNSLHPILIKRRVDNSVVSRSVVEAILVGNDANVSKTAE